MGLIILDRDNENGELRSHMRSHMRNNMGGSPGAGSSESFREGYRQGYKEGWEDYEKEKMQQEEFRRGRDSQGRFS